tara:strand:- start:12534 stop:13583 length:1050 start_codon:yes stop_codon:yes gene_type:complete
MSKSFIIQRGRQKSLVELFKKLDIPDYYHDFREWKSYKRFSIFGLITKSIITSFEFPKDLKLLICEGALCTLTGIFYKIKNPKTYLISYIIDPAFWIKNNSRFSIRTSVRSFLHRKYVDHTVCITNMVKEDALNNNFIRSYDKASVIPLHSTIRKKKPIVEYQYRSLSVSNCLSLLYIIDRPNDTAYTKGLDIIISICDSLSIKESNFELVIYGFGTEKLDLERPWLKKKGYSTDLLKAYEQADIFLLPSRYDASSIALLEAISYGLLPVVSNKVGSGEFLSHRYLPNINLVNKIDEISSWVKTIIEIKESNNSLKDKIISDLKFNIKDINLENSLNSFKNLIDNNSYL